MPRFRPLHVLIVGCLIISTALLIQAQSGSPSREETKAWVTETLRYFKLETKASPADIEQIADLKIKAHSPATSLPDRQAAYKELYTLLYRLAGTTVPEANLNFETQNAAQAAHALLTTGTVKPVGTATTPLGELGQVQKIGRGPVPMILIADARTDWTLYQSFMERNASKYTMYAITLPGYGGTAPPPRPASFDPAATPWWDGLEQGIVKLIEKNRLSKPVIVGSQASAYLAARMALDHPEQVRGVVLLNGSVYQSFVRKPGDPDSPPTIEERRRIVMSQPRQMGLFSEFAPQVVPTKEAMELRLKNMTPAQLVSLRASLHDVERSKMYFLNAGVGSDPRAYYYSTQTAGADLTNDLKNLKVPMLSLPAIYDDGPPAQPPMAPAQWLEVKMRYPNIPLTVAMFENTRSYITEDAPQELDSSIEAFLAGKPVMGRRSTPPLVLRASPSARVAQVIGATEINVVYGRPHVGNRKVWGGLVPYNRVWRTGANEATAITFSNDVMIEGQRLAAGTYNFFAIPTESEWTLIFNKITNQWGAFAYNAEFDALRVKVKPQTAEHQEWVNYSFELLSPASANMTLHWEKIKVSIKIEETPKASAAGSEQK